MKIKILSLVLIIVLIISFTGCEYEERELKSTEIAAKANEESINKLIKQDDLPKITRSLERENIKRRIEYINQPDNVGYLYLISENGQLIREIQVLGKVSSMNSYLTPMEELAYGTIETYGGSTRSETYIAEAADLDGTWGENADGIFWFDLDGVYGEWNGLYQYSSQRLTFTSQPLLVEATE